jgi:hypothetical protein
VGHFPRRFFDHCAVHQGDQGTLQTCQFWYYLIRAGSLGFRAWQGKQLTGALGHG